MEDIARQCQAAVIFPYYTPAPEKQFPFQFEQTYTALDHFVRNGSAHGLLVETFALAGDSVGGQSSNLATLTCADNSQATWPSP